MHPFRYAQLRGPMVFRAPENDEGHEFEGLDDQADLDEEDIDLDAGGDDDDQTDEGDDDDQGDDLDLSSPNQAQQRQPRKSFEQRVQEVADRRLADIQRKHDQDMEALRRQVSGPAPTTETPQAAQVRINAIEDPFERITAQMAFDRQQNAAMLNKMQFDTADAADRSAYDALAARTPIADKLRSEVEKRLGEMRAQGTTAPRETVLRWVIGDRALANAAKATGRARSRADQNLDRQRTRAPSGRGDQSRSSGRGDSVADLEKRLDGVQI